MKKHKQILSDFGFAVSALRYERGLTQQMLAKKAGLQRTYLAEVERGKRNATLKTIVQLARALGVTPADLVKDCDDDTKIVIAGQDGIARPCYPVGATKANKPTRKRKRFSAATRAKMTANARARWAKAKKAGKTTL